MRGCVGAEHEVFVDIIAICDCAAWVIGREGELVEVLAGGDKRGEGGEVGVGWEMGFYEAAEGAERVGWLGVQTEGEFVDYCG